MPTEEVTYAGQSSYSKPNIARKNSFEYLVLYIQDSLSRPEKSWRARPYPTVHPTQVFSAVEHRFSSFRVMSCKGRQILELPYLFVSYAVSATIISVVIIIIIVVVVVIGMGRSEFHLCTFVNVAFFPRYLKKWEEKYHYMLNYLLCMYSSVMGTRWSFRSLPTPTVLGLCLCTREKRFSKVWH